MYVWFVRVLQNILVKKMEEELDLWKKKKEIILVKKMEEELDLWKKKKKNSFFYDIYSDYFFITFQYNIMLEINAEKITSLI